MLAKKMKPSRVPWIGDMPVDWSTKRLKFLLENSEENIKVGPFGSALSGNDYTNDGKWVYNQRLVLDNNFETNDTFISEEKYQEMIGFKVNAGDILVTTRGSIGKIAIVPNEAEEGILHPCIIKFRIEKSYFLPELLKLVFNESDFVRDQFTFMSNSTTIEVIYSYSLKEIVLPCAPIAEQRLICSFLLKECAKIDTIIADLETQIETLKQYKKSLITETVTKGLDKSVPMKDSGIDWIPYCIPEKWDVKKIKHIFNLRDEKNYLPLEEVNLISLYTDLGVVQHSDLETTTGNKAYTADGYKKVYPNDIVVNIILCWMGAIGISKYEGVTSPAYDVYYAIDSSEVHPQYYHYLFKMEQFHGKCYSVGRGIMAMRWRTYSSEFKNIIVPLPPVDEQKAIAEFLDKKCSVVDEVCAQKKKQIEVLQQHKKSLIYEHVTGKKRVKEVQ